ncbi:MAG: hypothetical protein ABS52_07775 [Gemmatimonadetes bacterium SCN 70-22]|nr:MAG: hypothetical protein ABS52_07775 [Gemmatimonadetes bacterium SCN 70-22]
MQSFVFTSGTSVFGNLAKRGIEPQAFAITGQLIETLGSAANELSAEIGTLAASRAGGEDRLILLATDTEAGTAAAQLVRRIAELRFGVTAEVKVIPRLTLDDADAFRTEGLLSLVEELDAVVAHERERGSSISISVGAGINPVIPYVSIYAMLRRVPLTYRFQMTGTLVTLPPLPIGFDHDALRVAGRLLANLERDAIIGRHELVNQLGVDMGGIAGLFEMVDADSYTLSAFGLMLLGDLRATAGMQVMLSPAASRTLGEAGANIRDQFEHMLSRVRNPMWRAIKRHSYPTDLEVYKPGRTSCRLAGWTNAIQQRFYAAELFQHDEYERSLGSKSIRDYDEHVFAPWAPAEANDTPLDILSDDERMHDRILAEAARVEAEACELARRAEADVSTALEAAAAAESRLIEARTQWSEREDELNARVESYRAMAQDVPRKDATLLERLRWALLRR